MTAGTALPRPMVETGGAGGSGTGGAGTGGAGGDCIGGIGGGSTATAGTDRVPPAAVLQEEPVPAPQQALRVEPVEQQERVLLVGRRLDQLDQQR